MSTLRRALPFVPAVCLVAFLGWFGRAQADDRFWLLLGLQALWIGMAVIGVNLLLGYTGLLSLGHWAFFIYGGFVGAIWAVEDWGLDPWLGFPAAFLAGMLMGALLALTCVHLRGFYLTVMTLAFGLIASALALLFESAFSGLSGRGVIEPLDTNFGFLDPYNPNRPYVGLYLVGTVLLLFCLFVSWNLANSRWGRAYQAIRESELAAGTCGVPTYWYKVSVFALSAGMVSLAGVLAAQTNLQVTMADGTSMVAQSFRLVVYAVFGGLGTVFGPIVGAFVFTLGFGVELGGESLTERLGEWDTLFLGALVILITVAMPTGAVGTVNRRLRPWLAGAGSLPPTQDELPVRPTHEVASEEILLDLRSVTIAFGGVAALNGVDLEVRSGTIHALIGPNGSGKSTLANVVTGLYRPDHGRVLFRGRDIAGESPHRCSAVGLGRTFQTCQIWRRMSVIDNVLVGSHRRSRTGLVRSSLLPRWLRRDEDRLRRHASDLLRFVGLSDRAHDLAGSLPFIDQRRLEIARALASQPDLLILDEPAAGMHPSDLPQLVELIASVRRSGIGVLLIEHHMDVVMGLSDRITVLDYGRVLAEGTPAEVAGNPAVVEAYLGARESGDRAAVRRPIPTTASGSEPLLKVSDLTVRYGEAPALHDVSLEVHEGEVVALIGANGAGKTTTLKAISGFSELLMTLDGEISFAGRRIDRLPGHRIARLGLAHVPEGRRVFAESSVEENLLLGAHTRRNGDLRSEIEGIYERFPALGERRRRPAGLLSGGEQQMLAIGRALLARPRFLLLDEPSLGLAPLLVDEVFAAIGGLADEGISILLVEQMATKALGAADRAYILESGRVTRSGPAQELAGDAEIRAAYLGG